MTGFNVHLTGDEAARRKLAQFELFLEDLRPFLAAARPRLHRLDGSPVRD
jgi:hypothetical protein